MEGALEKRVFRFLVNGSDQVGRNLMKLQLTSILQLATLARELQNSVSRFKVNT